MIEFKEWIDELWVDDCGLSHLTAHTGANKAFSPGGSWVVCAKDWRDCTRCRQIVLQIPYSMTLRPSG